MGWRDMMESQGADEDIIKEVYKDVSLWINQNNLQQQWKEKHLGQGLDKDGRWGLKVQHHVVWLYAEQEHVVVQEIVVVFIIILSCGSSASGSTI